MSELSLVPQPLKPLEEWTVTDSNGVATKMYRLGSEVYPMKISRQCKTCKSPFRIPMEIAVLQGYPYATIIRSLPLDADMSIDSLSRHVRNAHMPLQEMQRRLTIERAAQALGQDVELHDGILGNQVTFAQLGLQRVMEMMAEGQLRPSIKDGIAFAKFLQNVESQAGDDIGLALVQEILSVYYDAVEEVVDSDTLAEIGRRIESDPRLAPIKAKIEKAVAAV